MSKDRKLVLTGVIIDTSTYVWELVDNTVNQVLLFPEERDAIPNSCIFSREAEMHARTHLSMKRFPGVLGMGMWWLADDCIEFVKANLTLSIGGE